MAGIEPQAGAAHAPLIAHVVHQFGTGGMENGMVNLIHHLPAERYRHAIVCLAGYTEFSRRIRRPAVSFHALDKRPGQDPAVFLRLYRLLRSLRPDIVHTRNLSALEAQFVAAAAGVRARVHGVHGRDMFDLHGTRAKYTLLRRAARPFIHRYIAVSRDLAHWLGETVGVAPQRVAQIYNGVDSLRFHPHRGARPGIGPEGFAPADSIVVGSVGRMAEVKDYPLLVRAFVELARRDTRLRLVIIGEGAARAPCRALLEEAGLGDRAWLPGERDDIPGLMRSLDLFVLPSLGEGISNTILEAMASGLPVVATRVGGNPELVEEGVTGRLVPAGDAGALARAIAAYLEAPAQLGEHGAAARRRIEADFSMDAMAAGYASVYDALIAERGMARPPGAERAPAGGRP